MPQKMVAIGLFVLAISLLGACSEFQRATEKSTAERLADQYEFENKYTDVDDPD